VLVPYVAGTLHSGHVGQGGSHTGRAPSPDHAKVYLRQGQLRSA
jgi:hypothetical protein